MHTHDTGFFGCAFTDPVVEHAKMRPGSCMGSFGIWNPLYVFHPLLLHEFSPHLELSSVAASAYSASHLHMQLHALAQ